MGDFINKIRLTIVIWGAPNVKYYIYPL